MKKQKKNTHHLLRLAAFAKPYLSWYVLIFITMFMTTVVVLLRPKIIQVLIDDHLSPLASGVLPQAVQDAHLSQALLLGLLYLGTIVFHFVVMYAYDFLTMRTGTLIVTDMRQKIYEHVLRLPMRYFDHHAIGSVVTRVANDTDSVLDLYTYVLTNLFRNLVLFLGVLVMMFSLDARLGFFIFLLTPAVIIISVIFQKQIRIVYDKQRAIRSLINTKLSENITGMSVIQTFFREKQIYQEFDATNTEYYKASNREVQYYAIYRPAIEIIRTLGLSLLFWFGGLAQMGGFLTFGVVYAFINYLQRLFMPIEEMAEIFNVMQSAFSSSERLFTLLDEPEEEYRSGIPVPEKGFIGKIEFNHVWFRYQKPEDVGQYTEEEGTAVAAGKDPAQWILKDVSFTIEPGSFVAFVGATGAGKSTILSLLARFYTVERGEILIDGVNVNDYDLVSLRRALGTVQQDVFLFKGDILSNIAIGRAKVDRRRAIEAAKLVNADAFISRLPKQYDEPVTERGSTLSAGQRQLLSFARTIAGDPSILILDEATANIDTETEQLIQSAISRMAKDRTMLAVAHRISTIADADEIIVMHHGRVAEQGTKDELIAQNGLFRVLYELQYGQEV